ncbi:50S ribosomal protein L17 [Patescibacteria group bacterium]|nr:50S ribosomal protein L17 [Patescibacteria group bacterium]
MRHGYFGRKLSRTKNERTGLFRNLVRSLIIHGQIKTTAAKARAVRPLAEKLVTKAKGGSRSDRNGILKVLADEKLTDLLVSDGKTRFAGRSSGFTSLHRLGARAGDNAEVVLLRFIDERVVTDVIAPDATKGGEESRTPERNATKIPKKRSVAKKSEKSK